MKKDYRLKTKKYYADMAGGYPENVAPWRVELLKNYAKGKKNVLELGCGTGNYLFVLPNVKITGIDLSKESLDKLKTRSQFIERSKSNKDNKNNKNNDNKFKKKSGKDNENNFNYGNKNNKDSINSINLVLGNITKLPFRNKSFDFCFSFSTLYYVKEIDVAIKEISRVTDKSGVVILEFGNSHSVNPLWDRTMFSVPQFAWSRKKIIKMIKDNGFEILEIKYRSLIPNFFNRFDNDFVKNRFLQRYCFRIIVVARKI